MTASLEEITSTSLLEPVLATVQELADVDNRHTRLLLSQWSYGPCTNLSMLLYTCSGLEASINLSRSIEELATMMGVLAMTESTEADLSAMSTNYLSFILTIAGRQKNHKTLKQILGLSWTSRNNYDFHFSARTTIAIGQRLAEVHLAMRRLLSTPR
ncbi:hypothetical protein F5B21DRAFT_525023 [Xylaria acuta]|nr:hypothetical protein F5B21DRAFT_525023 [Xylaria acuta]